jgi:hypothetical protein
VPSTASHSDAWLRWSLLTYELPAEQAGVRRSLWRQLQRRHALKLGPATWALPHDEDDDPRAEPLVATIEAAGGAIDVRLVGRSDAKDLDRQARVRSIAETCWDGFFNAADRLARNGGTRPDLAALDRLRRQYADLAGHDAVASDAATRAATLLDELASRALPAGDALGAGTALGVRLVAGWARDGEVVRYVARVEPLPDLRTERRFGAFESRIYQPSPGRVPLRHGLFIIERARSEREALLRSLRDRLDTFATFEG